MEKNEIVYSTDFTLEDFREMVKMLEQQKPKKEYFPSIEDLRYVASQDSGVFLHNSGMALSPAIAKRILETLDQYWDEKK